MNGLSFAHDFHLEALKGRREELAIELQRQRAEMGMLESDLQMYEAHLEEVQEEKER